HEPGGPEALGDVAHGGRHDHLVLAAGGARQERQLGPLARRQALRQARGHHHAGRQHATIDAVTQLGRVVHSHHGHVRTRLERGHETLRQRLSAGADADDHALVAAEREAEDQDQADGEEEDEEVVRAVAQEPREVRSRDREGLGHAPWHQRFSRLSRATQPTPPATSANAARASSSVPSAPTPPPPARSPRPCRNQWCGAAPCSQRSRPSRAGSWKNDPPTLPSVIAMIDWRLPAASAVRARPATSISTPAAAATSARMSSATPSGSPHSAPMTRVLAAA